MEAGNIRNTNQFNFNYECEKMPLSNLQNMEKESIHNYDFGVSYEKNSIIDYGLYTASGVPAQKVSNNYQIQNALWSLGFYSGPTDGQLTSALSKKAIKNFQTVYGLDSTGKMNSITKSKLNTAYNMKCKIANSSAINDIDKSIKKYTFDYIQRDTFANMWTFLRVGMGLTQNQTAGVCANILCESVFSPDNAQDSSYPGLHNKNYKYSTTDKVGYGLLQWTTSDRKSRLKNTAQSMGLSVSNINAQFACFREEMTSVKSFKNSWSQIKKAKTYKEASDIFLRNIEKPKIKNYTERRNYAKIIYDKMKKF